jgi:pyruvate/2-oxoglutarate dehydrogenase complex dihydrolipoamide dehydrogenase (E3) component
VVVVCDGSAGFKIALVQDVDLDLIIPGQKVLIVGTGLRGVEFAASWRTPLKM